MKLDSQDVEIQSRRKFVKTVATSLALACPASAFAREVNNGSPVAVPYKPEVLSGSASPIFKEHIPPIEFERGSMILKTLKPVSNSKRNPDTGPIHPVRPRKHTFDEESYIKWVRVTLTDGTIAIDFHKNNPEAEKGKIQIWTETPIDVTKPDLQLMTGSDNILLVEVDKIFGLHGSSWSHPHGRKYSGANAIFQLVRVYRSDGTYKEVKDDPVNHIVIERILVWTYPV